MKKNVCWKLSVNYNLLEHKGCRINILKKKKRKQEKGKKMKTIKKLLSVTPIIRQINVIVFYKQKSFYLEFTKLNIWKRTYVENFQLITTF